MVGSPSSSNTNRLREVASNMKVLACLVGNTSELNQEWLQGNLHIGISAGVSAPELLMQDVIARIKELGVNAVREIDGIAEK